MERPVRAVTYEPTGRWHRAFEVALHEADLPLVRVNPLQARRFAQAIGQRAKTDAVDARMLAQMGAALDLRRTEAASPARRTLEELQVARDALVKDRTAALNRQKQLQHRLLRRQNTNRLSQIDRHLAAVDAEIAKCLAEDEVLTRRTEILTSIPGVSRVTAAGLLTQMPELGSLDAKRRGRPGRPVQAGPPDARDRPRGQGRATPAKVIIYLTNLRPLRYDLLHGRTEDLA